jgi:hypothetical protein
MKNLLRMTFVTALLLGMTTHTAPVTAQVAPDVVVTSCEPLYVNIKFAKTRIGDLCLFRGNWICAADMAPNPDCDKPQPKLDLEVG